MNPLLKPSGLLMGSRSEPLLEKFCPITFDTFNQQVWIICILLKGRTELGQDQPALYQANNKETASIVLPNGKIKRFLLAVSRLLPAILDAESCI